MSITKRPITHVVFWGSQQVLIAETDEIKTVPVYEAIREDGTRHLVIAPDDHGLVLKDVIDRAGGF